MAASALISGAVISTCGKYRTRLWRIWAPELPRLLWVMLNPSTADAETNDATIRKIMAFAKRWGCGGIEVVNLYSFRTKSPAELADSGWDCGPDNDRTVRAMLAQIEFKVIAAWGVNALKSTENWFRYEAMRAGQPLYHLGLTKDGHPRHPLYVRGDTELTEWL